MNVDGNMPITTEPQASEPRPSMESHAQRPGAPRRWWLWLLVFATLGGGGYWLLVRAGEQRAATAEAAARPAAPAIPVVAAAARQGDLPVYLTGLGAVTPVYTVTVHTRVDGQLMKVLYREGQIVREGAPLAEIDVRPFQAALVQAEGQLARDQALLQEARIDLERFKVLWSQDSIAKQVFDQQVSLVKQLEGTVKLDQGQLDAAAVNVAYCHITAPISGRVGLRLVDPGNIVHAADTNGLLVITQLQPITVIFTIAEDHLPPVYQRLNAGEQLVVDAYDRAVQKKLATGSLLTIDNQIDPTTGTVKLKAMFPNADNGLFPNQFVNARLQVEMKREVALVPDTAIQRTSQNTFVYVVKPDQTVTVRQVTVGATEGNEASIDTGLAPGDIVVVNGVDKLQEGSKVHVQMSGTDVQRENG
jgi:membrane fusion protein, multidrug efflux system